MRAGCGFCGLAGTSWRGPERDTADEADADWRAHVLDVHQALAYTQQHRTELERSR